VRGSALLFPGVVVWLLFSFLVPVRLGAGKYSKVQGVTRLAEEETRRDIFGCVGCWLLLVGSGEWLGQGDGGTGDDGVWVWIWECILGSINSNGTLGELEMWSF